MICIECKKPIDNPTSLRKKIHPDCNEKRIHRRNRARAKNPIGTTIPCKYCDKPFTKEKTKQSYCNEHCRHKHGLEAEKIQRLADRLARQHKEDTDPRWPIPEAPKLPDNLFLMHKVFYETRRI